MKRLFVLIMLAASVATISAQRFFAPNFTVGVKAGASLSRMSFSPSVKQSFRPGVTVGVTARYTEENHFGLIAELLFSQKGWNENFEGAPYQYGRTLNYIELPILTHIFFGSRRAKGFVNLGPQVGYLLSDKISTSLTPWQDLPQVVSPRTTDQMWMNVEKRFDYGICGGLGGEYRLTPKQSILIEARFYFGLGNIYPAGKADTFSASRSISIQASAAYLFRVK